MYLVELKTILTQALRLSFDSAHRVEEFRNLPVSIEFPEKQQDYPGVWVDFEPTHALEVAGIAHREYVNDNATVTGYTRWRFQGYATYTAVALTSLERDRLIDEIARIFASGRENDAAQRFRQYIEENPYIAANVDFDQIEQRGFASSPGTPWQSDEIIYEGTLAMEVIGEFVTDLTGTVIAIEGITVQEYTDIEPVPPWPGEPST